MYVYGLSQLIEHDWKQKGDDIEGINEMRVKPVLILWTTTDDGSNYYRSKTGMWSHCCCVCVCMQMHLSTCIILFYSFNTKALKLI